MVQTLTKQETEKVKEYADWLREGKDKLEFRIQCFGQWYETREMRHTFQFTVWNSTKDIDKNYHRGMMSFSSKDLPSTFYCDKSHDCNDHDHLDYFKPIAESLYRKYMLKKICGGLFNG